MRHRQHPSQHQSCENIRFNVPFNYYLQRASVDCAFNGKSEWNFLSKHQCYDGFKRYHSNARILISNQMIQPILWQKQNALLSTNVPRAKLKEQDVNNLFEDKITVYFFRCLVFKWQLCEQQRWMCWWQYESFVVRWMCTLLVVKIC